MRSYSRRSHSEEVTNKQIKPRVMRHRGKERQEVGQHRQFKKKSKRCGLSTVICTVGTERDGLIAPLTCLCVCFFNRAGVHALGSAHLATSSSITQKEAGEKRTVISVKANEIKPNLIVLPYGQTPDSTEGRGRGQRCLRCCTCAV